MAYMRNRVILKGKSRLNDWDRSKEDLINELVELRRQVALLRNLAGSEKEMSCQTLDGEGRIIDINKAWTDLLGFTGADVYGRQFREFVRPGYADLFSSQFLYPVVNGENPDVQLEMLHRDGSRLNVLLSGTAVYDNEGSFIGIYCILYDITGRKRVEEALGAERRRLYSVLNELPAIVYLQAPDYTIPFANRLFREQYGNPEGRYCYEVIHGMGGPCEECLTFLPFKTQRPQVWETVKPSGRVLQIYDYPFYDIDGSPLVLELGIDITERRRAEEALRESEEKYRTILDSIEDGYFEVDISGNLTFLNNSAGKISGYQFQELIGANYRKFTPPDVVSRLFKVFNKIFETGIPEKLFDWEIIRKDGSRGYLEASVSPIKDSEGKIGGFRSVARDVSERKRAEDQLRFLSLHDPLTGLYNRAYFEQEMHRLSGGRLDPVGIIMCDVDGLKLVNDTLGHEAGDRLLKGAATAIKMSFRSSDVVSRIGGDEFAVLLPNSGRADIESAVGRIREAVSDLNSANPDLPLSLSLGFAVNENNSDLDSLFREADNSMYREKLHSRQSARSAIVMTLMKAMEVRDFVTEGHAERMQGLVAGLAKEMGLPEYRVTNMRLLAQFHDIGKVGIPDLILFKPGPLTSKEKNDMQRHCEIGHRIAQSLPDTASIADWILKHHEWWNGCGYPLGLRGEEIPLECRMLAIIDAYDAMTSDRPYRKAMSREEALRELERNAGTQFDPQLVPVFIRLLEKQAGK